VSTNMGAQAPRVGPGWYLDPYGPPNQLRWWDGRSWATAVHPLGLPYQHGPTAPPAGGQQPRRARKAIVWTAVAGFALAAAGTAYAMARGQDVCEVSASGIKFCGDASAQVEEGQEAITEQAAALEEQAQEASGTSPPVGVADLGGTWRGDNGFDYVIEQFGDQAVISELTPDGLITAVGMGPVEGSLFVFDFEAADGSTGVGQLELDGDDTLSGVFENFASGFSVPATLRR
jgi:hypothetical protein